MSFQFNHTKIVIKLHCDRNLFIPNESWGPWVLSQQRAMHILFFALHLQNRYWKEIILPIPISKRLSDADIEIEIYLIPNESWDLWVLSQRRTMHILFFVLLYIFLQYLFRGYRKLATRGYRTLITTGLAL